MVLSKFNIMDTEEPGGTLCLWGPCVLGHDPPGDSVGSVLGSHLALSLMPAARPWRALLDDQAPGTLAGESKEQLPGEW